MHSDETDEARTRRLRRQRNLLAALAACSIASIGFALPRKVASHRELKALNERLVELQTSLLQNEGKIRYVQDQIHQVQQLIVNEASK